LNALAETGLLDSGPEEAFDRLTRLAARVSGTPLALVNLIAADRQFSKSCFVPQSWSVGPNLPLADSFCKYAVRSREALAIRDARQDSRVASSRMVTREGLVSYLGIPLITSTGHVLGTLCVGDFRPREWKLDEIEGLNDLATSVVTEIELRSQVRETEEAEQLASVADQERNEKTALLQSTTEGIYGIDSRGRCTFLNAAGAEMLGYTPEECLGRNMHALIHHTRPDGMPYPKAECPVFHAFRKGEAVRMKDEVLWRKDGTSFVALYSSSPIWEGDVVRGAVVTFSDITERKRDEDAQQFFSRASKMLAESTLDYTATLRMLTRLSVPALGDWCSLYMLQEDGSIERLEIAHADPEKERIAQKLRDYPVDPAGPHPAFEVLRTGEPILIPEIPDTLLKQVAQDEEHLRILRQLGMHSGMVVPLKARGRTLGSLICVVSESERRYTDADLGMAQEFAHRAALAVDNARLFHRSQEANRTKAEFLAVVSHELRTPLNAVTGYTELLRDGIPEPLPEKSLKYVERIGLSAQHLLHLIEEILSFTRLETDRESVRSKSVQPQGLVAEIHAIIAPVAEEKHLRFVVDAPDDLPRIETDPGKLRQILHNLLDNAIKFTSEGEVGLGVSLQNEQILFRVWDTGMGIAPEDRADIFEPFRQLEQSHTRSVGGTGLGLTVTERLVRLLGGTLELESEVGKGTTFTVRLPAQRAR
jgi:PAS domain S-box-containing protein